MAEVREKGVKFMENEVAQDDASARRGRLERNVPIQLVLEQEHCLLKDRCDQEASKSRPWRGQGSASAIRTAARANEELLTATFASTFVAVPRRLGMERLWLERTQQAAKVSLPGRLAEVWVPLVGGLTAFCFYFYFSEGWTERNMP